VKKNEDIPSSAIEQFRAQCNPRNSQRESGMTQRWREGWYKYQEGPKGQASEGISHGSQTQGKDVA
jgi:hypothetical protein